MADALTIEADALEQWLVERALPFWAENAVDDNGGWYEHLALDGTPNDVIRRLRVQARQIYVYALADKQGWYDGTEIVENTFRFICEHGFEPDDAPGFIHLFNPDYSVNNPRRDLYDHAFYLLASLWAGEKKTERNIQDFLATLKSPRGGWSEGVPEKLPRRQNPHMHMFETSLHGFDISGDERWLNRAKDIFELFETHFFDHDHHIVREFFTQDWKIVDGDLGETSEPGHAAEWIWLLWMFEQRTGIDTSDYAEKLYTTILKNGDGFLNDQEDVSGKPRRDTKRLWVQTELIKAHLAQTERGVENSRERAAKIISEFRETYLQDNGTWVDQIDACGKPIATTIPTSTFYHIACMIYEAKRVAKLL